MLNTDDVKRRLGGAFTQEQVDVLTGLLSELHGGLATSVDMEDLKDVVKALAVAQARAEERLEGVESRMDRVEAALDRLEAAQARAEKRLEALESRMDRVEAALDRLEAAQARAEKRLEALESRMEGVEDRMDRVEAALDRLEAAQARAEKRLEALEDRMDRVEATLDRLAAAQARTEEALEKLTEAHDETRKQLGGLSHTVGYILENEAYRALPALLKAEHGIEVEDRLIRTYLTTDRGYPVEVNIFGRGRRNGREVVILGESKSQLSAKHIDHFIQGRLTRLEPLFEEVFAVLVTHMISSPDVAAYAQERGIALYYSYQF